jgi:hypothetical protein
MSLTNPSRKFSRTQRRAPNIIFDRFMILAAARHTVLRKVGWDVESEGLFAAPPVTVIVGGSACDDVEGFDVARVWKRQESTSFPQTLRDA